jgi:hypothetical protein
MEGHRWLVPGFTATVLDTDVSYGCWVKSHTFSVGPNGEEESSIQVSHVRPLPQLSKQNIEDAQNIDNLRAERDRAQTNLTSEYQEVADKNELVALDAVRFKTELPEGAFEEYSQTGRVSPGVSGFEITTPKEAKEAERTIQNAMSSFSYFEAQFKKVRMETVGNPSVAGKLFLQENPGMEGVINAAWDGLNTANTATFGGRGAGEQQRLVTYLSNLSENTVRNMAIALNKFSQYQVTNAKTVVEDGPSHMSKLSTFGDKNLAASQQSLTTAVKNYGAAWDSRTDYPYPPVFANMKLIDLWEVEKIYEQLLGAKPIFTKIAGERGIQRGSIVEDDSIAAQQKSYVFLSKYFAVLSKIFPTTPDVRGSTEWDSVSSDEGNSAPRKWMDKRFLRRQRLTTLGQFLKTNDLKLVEEESNKPTVIKFYRMVPLNVYPVTAQFLGKSLNWDDTIFSKIIDEAKDVERNVSYLPPGQTGPLSATGTPRSSDPNIQKLRETVKNEYLTTEARQALVLAYSQAHFGARAYDGR